MPVKNIIPGQTVTKEKLPHARELRRDMHQVTLSGFCVAYFRQPLNRGENLDKLLRVSRSAFLKKRDT